MTSVICLSVPSGSSQRVARPVPVPQRPPLPRADEAAINQPATGGGVTRTRNPSRALMVAAAPGKVSGWARGLQTAAANDPPAAAPHRPAVYRHSRTAAQARHSMHTAAGESFSSGCLW